MLIKYQLFILPNLSEHDVFSNMIYDYYTSVKTLHNLVVPTEQWRSLQALKIVVQFLAETK